MKIEISNGELVDKFTILKIKLSKALEGSEKYNNIKKEYDYLKDCILELNIPDILIDELFDINLKLWNIEEDIRLMEKEKDFKDQFISLARSVYITNDIRFSIKTKINNLTFSSLKEEKILPLYE
jgi:hypothetical protein